MTSSCISGSNPVGLTRRERGGETIENALNGADSRDGGDSGGGDLENFHKAKRGAAIISFAESVRSS